MTILLRHRLLIRLTGAEPIPINELSSRPEEPWAFGPPKEMKIADNLRLCPSHVTVAKVTATLPFVIPSEAEGPAVRLSRPKTSHGNVFRQSVAKWRDLGFHTLVKPVQAINIGLR
jgi:hypothetical protein